ncbi:MAG TPA: hypothetical protein ENJ37_06240 [Deltaproteobacteria bacterium]|nr:hypothetical protein [Deltaproteobacteria bacterium]
MPLSTGVSNRGALWRLISRVVSLAAALHIGIGVGLAGEYHATKEETFSKTTETLACSQCHTMHGTQGGASMIYTGGTATYPALIRAASIVELCRTCHEANSLGMSNPTPPDVWNNTLGYVASAGDFNDRGVSPANEANRHSVGQSNKVPPGSNPTLTIPYFSCISCHDQHGNTNFRNLRFRPGNATSDITVSYRLDNSSQCSDGTSTPCDVNNDTTSNPLSQANLTKYQRDNVTFTRTASNTNGIAAWCGGCHNDFHGAGGASNMGGSPSGDTNTGNPWKRHPVRDVDINEGQTNMHADRANWASEYPTAQLRVVNPDDVDPTSSVADEQPFCLTCHYAHGGGNPNSATDPAYDHSNLVQLDTSVPPKLNIESGYNTSTGMLRNVCQKCHNQ